MSHLRDVVLPSLDAAAAGLLEHLEPRSAGGGRYYTIICPSCGGSSRRTHSAFYRPGYSGVRCNRQDNCPAPYTSIWDIVATSEKLEGRDVYTRLCEAAGVEPESPQRDRGLAAPVVTDEGRALMATARRLLWESDEALAYLRGRGYSDSDIETLGYGYYPSEADMRSAITADGGRVGLAREWGLLPEPQRRDRFARRIIGWWPQTDGSYRPWGRAIDADADPKYLFSTGMQKDLPYGLRGHGDHLVAVEGTFDRDALHLMGYHAGAVGGTSVIEAQARSLLYRRFRAVTHLIDPGVAGERGALSTIEQTEPRGLTAYIAMPPSDLDADDARRHGREEAIHDAITNALNAGEFLALRLSSDVPATRTREHILSLASQLTPTSRLAFERACAELGIPTMQPTAAALRLAAGLLEAGVGDEEVQQVVDRRFGIALSWMAHLPPADSMEDRDGS